MKGMKLKNTTITTFPESFSIWQRIWAVCLKMPSVAPIEKHLPFGQVLGLGSHTALM